MSCGTTGTSTAMPMTASVTGSNRITPCSAPGVRGLTAEFANKTCPLIRNRATLLRSHRSGASIRQMPPISTNNYWRLQTAQYLGALFRGRKMKLATLKDGTRDGKLVVVSKDLTRAVAATAIAGSL